MLKYLITCSLFLGLPYLVFSQHTEIFHPHIQTVQVIAHDDFEAPAILDLNDEEDFLEISFDELSHEYHRYYYTITHCNADWTPSNISELDYLSGFNNNNIEEYELSINTTVPYTHYKFTIPNENISLTLGGNYQLTVFNDEDNNQPAFTTSFRILNEQVSVSASVSSDTNIDRNKSHQQVNFVVNYKNYPLRNPREEVTAQVYQNQRLDNAVTNIYPTYLNNYQLKYEQNRKLIFPAGNEYRRFETVSMRFPNMHVENLTYFKPYYHVTLMTDTPRNYNYSFDKDQNGSFLIRYDIADDSDLEADYCFVHFSLPCNHPFQDGKLYIQSKATYQIFSPINEMKYNTESQSYECGLLLKQGSYNYQYVYVAEGKQTGDTAPIEGNFYETENEYLILIYGHKPSERHEELIGMQKVNFKP